MATPYDNVPDSFVLWEGASNTFNDTLEIYYDPKEYPNGFDKSIPWSMRAKTGSIIGLTRIKNDEVYGIAYKGGLFWFDRSTHKIKGIAHLGSLSSDRDEDGITDITELFNETNPIFNEERLKEILEIKEANRKYEKMKYVPKEPPFKRPVSEYAPVESTVPVHDARIGSITTDHYVYDDLDTNTNTAMKNDPYKVGHKTVTNEFYAKETVKVESNPTTIPVLNKDRNYVVSQPNVNGDGLVHLSIHKTEIKDPVTGVTKLVVTKENKGFNTEQLKSLEADKDKEKESA